jgi:hypothetical protein
MSSTVSVAIDPEIRMSQFAGALRVAGFKVFSHDGRLCIARGIAETAMSAPSAHRPRKTARKVVKPQRSRITKSAHA